MGHSYSAHVTSTEKEFVLYVIAGNGSLDGGKIIHS
jgi:hypothetical protein